jgi:hypothetical protein
VSGVEIDTSDVDRVIMDIREFRNTYYRAVKGGLKDAAEKTIVPEIQRRAVPQRYRFLITAKARGVGTVVLTTKGALMPGRILGMHNYGGRLARPMYPKKARAIYTRFGPKGALKGETKVPRREFFERGIAAGMDAYCGEVGDAVADRLQEAFTS